MAGYIVWCINYLIVMSSYSRSAGEGLATIIRCSLPVVWRRGAAAEIVALERSRALWCDSF